MPNYQRVGAATYGSSSTAGTADYDTAGFPPYLKFDGVDDSLSTASINFTNTDKMTVFAGVRKLSDAGIGIIAELSVNGQSNAGSFYLSAPDIPAANYGIRSGGNLRPTPDWLTTYISPISNIITGYFDISADVRLARINGVQVLNNTADQGTGNFGNYPLYIGARNNAEFRFNGRLYQLLIVGALEGSGEINNTETWINNKTRAY